MDIVLVSQYLGNLEDKAVNNRFISIAKLASKNDNINMEIVTSNFFHKSKRHFNSIVELSNIKITSIHEPGYKKNISYRRYLSHKKLAINISNYLKKRKKPDLCICAVPSIDVAYLVGKYCKENGVKFIIDIQDLWPEAFKMVLRVPILSDLLFLPISIKAKKVYSMADEIIGVSKTFVNRGLKFNKKKAKGEVLYIGYDLDLYDKTKTTLIKEKKELGELWIIYVGSLSNSYDLNTAIKSVSYLKKNGYNNLKLLILGTGHLRERFETMAKKEEIDVIFTGHLSHDLMNGYLNNSDIALNPIKKGSAASIINKHANYSVAGLPVINSQENIEYRDIIDNYNIGLNCNCEDYFDMAEKLKILIENKDLRILMGRNNRKFAEKFFDRKKTYNKYLNLIKNYEKER